MLVHKQIKTLARPYTDRAMVKQADCLALGPESTMWSNGTVVFFEPGPKSPPNDFEPGVLTQATLEKIRDWRASPGVQVWPVEIGPLYNGELSMIAGGLILLRFVDQFGYSHWFDARYVSAIMKRHPDPDWYFDEGRLTARDSTPVTIAAGETEVTLPKGDPIAILKEWAWGPDAAAAIDRYRAWDPDWRLSNTGLKTWHTLRWAQELDRALPRGKKGGVQFTGSGTGRARRVKVGKHKYIELAGESGRACVRISLYNGEITNLIQEVIQ